MLPRHLQAETEADTRSKWFSSPVVFHKGMPEDICNHIPDFERRGFALTQPDNKWTRLNERLDTIIRKPFGEDPNSFL